MTRGRRVVAAGTPIPVAAGATTSGIDFALDRTGTISGTVREAATGAPLDSIRVRIWDADGSLVEAVLTGGSSGAYTITGLEPGTYFVGTWGPFWYYYKGFADQLHDGVPCFLGLCDPTTGTPVQVGLNSPPAGIDFFLDLHQGISG